VTRLQLTPRRLDWIITAILALGAVVWLLSVEGRQGIGRDEAQYFRAGERYWGWFSELGDNLAAGHPGHGRGTCHCPGIPSSPSASFWRSLVSASGASGCSSMLAMNPPRGVSATNVMARPRSAARKK